MKSSPSYSGSNLAVTAQNVTRARKSGNTLQTNTSIAALKIYPWRPKGCDAYVRLENSATLLSYQYVDVKHKLVSEHFIQFYPDH